MRRAALRLAACASLGLALCRPAAVSAAAAEGGTAAPPIALRLCTADQPFYPFTLPDGRGRHQHLLRLAAGQLRLQLINYTAPRPRCLQDLRSGHADAAVGLYAEDRLSYAAYPLDAGGRVDPQRGLGPIRFMVYRRRGSAVGWDGQRFDKLGGGSVGVQAGYVYGPRLAALGVPIDDRGVGAEQLMLKLERGRNEAVIMQEEEGQRLLDQRFAASLEQLEPPFDVEMLYLLVARSFQAAHPQLVERYWRAIAAARQSPAYQQYRPAPPLLPAAAGPAASTASGK
ncbi:substrate-binding periplasmic protein [Roseateles violae]|uniref:Solute-binding protein family 3/N-terminal domain-containing protein n=1 Tax=Roseateles violae TaxID=3058042 RepID=A0ABT8DX80_9BURK|nr:hypothetical protein [Pelomonas sp. PFR6]MDN3921224.1 hypothetical protein [Pelomonas sp. PFR6]